MTCTDHTLCLSKKDAVYVTSSKLSQHHIDGIRFTYRQFKKKNPGVIINDGPKSRRLQIVLFIQAVCRQFGEKPSVLVLCEAGDENEWMLGFHTHTDLGDDVVIEASRKFPKRSIVISSLEHSAWLGARPWRLAVVDDDRDRSTVLQYTMKADFKIWSTSVNMKKNLDMFTSVYQWIYPKHKFNSSEFTADRSSVKDVIDKAILLDAFMEDIVIRRKDLDAVPKECQKPVEQPKPVSRKNKDATGTKIKRSKRRIEESEPICNVTSQKPSELRDEGLNGVVKSKVILDSVPSDKQPDEDRYKDNTSQENKMKLQLEPDSVPADISYELDTQVDETTSLSVNELNTDITKVENIQNIDDDKSLIKQESEEPFNKKSKTEVDDMETDLDLIETKEIEYHETLNRNDLENSKNVLIAGVNELKTYPQIIANDSDAIASDEKLNEIEVTIPETEDKDSMEIDNSDVCNEIKEKTKYNQSTKDIEEDEINDSQNQSDNLTADKSNNKTFTNDNDKSKVGDFEHKKNEFMEQALKRFKGSVFDSLF